MSLAPYYIDKARLGFGFEYKNITDAILKDGLWDLYNNFLLWSNCADFMLRRKLF